MTSGGFCAILPCAAEMIKLPYLIVAFSGWIRMWLCGAVIKWAACCWSG